MATNKKIRKPAKKLKSSAKTSVTKASISKGTRKTRVAARPTKKATVAEKAAKTAATKASVSKGTRKTRVAARPTKKATVAKKAAKTAAKSARKATVTPPKKPSARPEADAPRGGSMVDPVTVRVFLDRGEILAIQDAARSAQRDGRSIVQVELCPRLYESLARDPRAKADLAGILASARPSQEVRTPYVAVLALDNYDSVKVKPIQKVYTLSGALPLDKAFLQLLKKLPEAERASTLQVDPVVYRKLLESSLRSGNSSAICYPGRFDNAGNISMTFGGYTVHLEGRLPQPSV